MFCAFHKHVKAHKARIVSTTLAKYLASFSELSAKARVQMNFPVPWNETIFDDTLLTQFQQLQRQYFSKLIEKVQIGQFFSATQ